MTCTYAELDGAYVLGALCPSERAAFESHLRMCDACRESVTELAVLPGLLGRLSPETAEQLTPSAEAPVTAPTTLLPRLIEGATRRRRHERRTRRIWLVAVAVACLAVVVGMGVHAFDMNRIAPPVDMTSMRPMDDHMPVSAEVGLTPVKAGTQVHMACRYEEGYEGKWTLWLVVYPIVGAPEQVGSWTAYTGDEISLTATTHYPPEQIGHIELRNSKEMLMSWTPS